MSDKDTIVLERSGYPRSEGIILYKDLSGRTHWKLYPQSRKGEEKKKIWYNLATNPKVDNSSILVIPAMGSLGGIWLDPEAHGGNGRADLWDLYSEFDINPKREQVSKTVEEEIKTSNFKQEHTFGFIRPDGKHFGCAYQGHSSLAYDICYGTIDTNNPERWLEEHGWIKVMMGNGARKYFIYLEEGFKITKEQFKTLQDLGLENAENVNALLSRG